MDNAELEVALEELESRLERLRALYEQYFMGIERIEPAIPRKDIDRRIYVLRREKIRNTAKRFKLQTIISRYNTFQQYWQRICREIEQGTYKRHVIKAERIAPGKLLTVAARKRLGRAALDAMEPADAAPELPVHAEGVAAATESPAASVPSVASGLPATTTAVAPQKPAPRTLPGGRPAKPGSNPQPAPPAFENSTLDFDFLGDWDPSATAPKPAPAKEAIPRAPAAAPPSPRGTKPGIGPEPKPPTPNAAPPLPLPLPPQKPGLPPQKPALPAQRPPLPAQKPPLPPTAPPALRVNPGSAPPPKPVAVPPRPRASSPPLPPVTHGLQPSPGPQPNVPPKPAIVLPAVARPAAVQPTVTPGVSPRPAPPQAAPKPAAPQPAAPHLAAKPAGAASDERVRELHARLVEAKRQTQDAGTVSLEGLAKSMKATEAKLREIHKNRKIDFDVVIKDGKAVLKPIVR